MNKRIRITVALMLLGSTILIGCLLIVSTYRRVVFYTNTYYMFLDYGAIGIGTGHRHPAGWTLDQPVGPELLVIARAWGSGYEYGISLAIPFLVMGGVGFQMAWPFLRRARRNACESCGYDLSGTASSRCPECGCEVKGGKAFCSKTLSKD